jgi:hypothetical protein
VSTRIDKPYSELGKLLDSIARKRDIRGPYNVAKWISGTTDYQISGQGVSRIFYGLTWPKPSFIAAFAQAFNLSFEERDSLAWFYTYRQFPDENSSSPLKLNEATSEGM